MFLALLSAVVIGLSLGLLGSGGAILTIPVLVYLFDQPEKLAIASSLIIIAFIALITALPAIVKKRVNWHLVAIFSGPSYLGTFMGVKLAAMSEAWLQMLFFALITLLAGIKLIAQPTIKKNTKPVYAKLLFTSLMVGATTGFIGVGGGFLIIPALVLLAGCSLKNAVPISLLIILGNALLGFWQYQSVLVNNNLTLDWHIIGLISAVGALAGLSAQPVAKRCSQALLSKIFGYLLILIAISVTTKNVLLLI